MSVGEVELFVEEAGPPDGRPVLLLHGFPDSSELWRLQIPALAAAGYRVIAPDQRGFGRSSKPAGVEQYGVELLVGDVVGLLDTIGVERASPHVASAGRVHRSRAAGGETEGRLLRR